MSESVRPPRAHRLSRRSPRGRGRPGRGTAWAAGVLTGALLVTACGPDPAPTTASATAAGCASSENDTAPAGSIPIAPAAVTLTDPGAEPRVAATAIPDRAAAQQVTLATISTEESAAAATAQTVTLPLTARFSCTDDAAVALRLGTPTSTDPALNAQLAAAGGTGTITRGPGLAPISLQLAPPDAAAPAARNAVEQSLVQALQTAIALPDAPIGVGATWHAERTVSAAVTAVQTISARLTRRDGNRLTVTFTAEEEPVNSVFSVPGSTPLTITRYSYSGSGEVAVDLTRGLPVDGSLTYRGARELVGADATTPLIQQIGFAATWTS
ncbi:MAG: hypothetical protein QM662_00985 [Gordonia sp. (in: high G+C Gram-positive bacteria)]